MKASRDTAIGDRTVPMTDLLTGLADAGTARAWLDEAGRDGPVLAMLVALPRMQAVNIAYGTAGGDLVLVEAAQRLLHFADSELGKDCLVARLGGGQFVLASREVGDATTEARARWQYLAQALGRVISRALTIEGEDLHIAPRTALLVGAPGERGEALIDRLDQTLALLERMAGRRTLWADDPQLAAAVVPGRGIAELESDLLGAMHRDEITVLFQPQFDVATGALAGAEALARWEHPRFGRISADTLFAVADRGDHVAQLSHHIAARALALAAQWPGALKLSLNITAEDFAVGTVVQTIRDLLAQTGFPAARLMLEITEQSLIGDFAAAARALATLAQDGVRVALDDFGTGFSNFRALKALPLDALKLDRSLVRDIAQDPRDRAIVAAMIAMARALDCGVIAEGIETAAQLAILRELGCDLYQGFLRSGPLDPQAFLAMC